MVVRRIFQKVPNLLKDLEDQVEDQVEEEGGGQYAKKRKLIELVLEKVGH